MADPATLLAYIGMCLLVRGKAWALRQRAQYHAFSLVSAWIGGESISIAAMAVGLLEPSGLRGGGVGAMEAVFLLALPAALAWCFVGLDTESLR